MELPPPSTCSCHRSVGMKATTESKSLARTAARSLSIHW